MTTTTTANNAAGTATSAITPQRPPPAPPPSAITGGHHYSIDPELIEQRRSPATTPSKPTRSPATPPPPPPSPTALPTTKMLVMDKTLSTAANLSKLLPTGTFLIFQALSPSFSNKGHCYTSNQCLTSALIFVCVLSCIFFTFTDSVVGRDGRLYYGVATSEGLYVLNFDGGEEEKGKVFKEEELRRRRRRWVDWVHAGLGVLVFLALAMSDADIQSCFLQEAGQDAKELLVNLPLGAGVLAGLVFMMFPTTRKGIGYSDVVTHS
ncbi:uncharacterized protein LOC110029061 [Phalaenopsis equestris]|uniref:uncharacterized protein LOC110029061 n=1 Tax=Phalaenopsis equestris TaxID=78828 RepID=UPI0009E39B88|nr:uncharacterized protein LOC110029061 [Phalaenopsis equestris]